MRCSSAAAIGRFHPVRATTVGSVNTPATSTQRPALLLVGFAIIALEILGLIIAAVWMLIDRPTGVMSGWGYALTFSAVILLFAGLLFLGLRALWRGMRWGRGPVVAWQLLQFFTAVTMSDVIGKPAAWAVGLVSIFAVIAILAPGSLQATDGVLREPDHDAPA